MISYLVLAASIYSQCTSIQIHKEWRELSQQEQTDYLTGIKCLREKPSLLAAKFNGTTTELPTSRWEDWVFAHANKAPHGSPDFLPFHRALLASFDKAMKEECGYQGAMPYWDWSIDSEAPEKSVICESLGTSGCVQIPVAGNLTSGFPFEHCVNRYGNLMYEGSTFAPEQMAFIMDRENYNDFREELEFNPHNMVHSSIGGDMSQVQLSPNDPIFFFHHRNIDRLWAKWQKKNETFLNQYTGQSFTQTGPVQVQLTDVMEFMDVQASMQVKDVMDTKSGALGLMCFEYSNSITPVEPVLTKRAFDKRAGGRFDTTTPARNDRTNLFNIRVPNPIPTEFLKQWMYTDAKIAKVRQTEENIKKFTDFINKMPLVFPSALIQHEQGKSKGWRSKTAAEAEAEDKLAFSLVRAFKSQ